VASSATILLMIASIRPSGRPVLEVRGFCWAWRNCRPNLQVAGFEWGGRPLRRLAPFCQRSSDYGHAAALVDLPQPEDLISSCTEIAGGKHDAECGVFSCVWLSKSGPV
jgi:hypothetical protein